MNLLIGFIIALFVGLGSAQAQMGRDIGTQAAPIGGSGQGLISPSITTSIVTPSTTFSLLNSVATTINTFGAATTLNIGNASGTNTIRGATAFSQGLTASAGATIASGQVLTLTGATITGPVTASGAISGTTGAFSGAVTMPGLATSSAGTTGTMCWTTGTGNINVDTTTTCLLSSGKYKQAARPLNVGLRQVLALRPVSYKLRDQYNPSGLGEQIGFFAEDVVKVEPRLVSTEADGSPHAVRYQQMTAMLVRAIQEQQAQIDALKREIHQARTVPAIYR